MNTIAIFGYDFLISLFITHVSITFPPIWPIFSGKRLFQHRFKSNLKILVTTQIVVIPVVGHGTFSSGLS